jgi:putative FmdB family regulatory protein
MPTYEYLCDACGHRFEQFQNITGEPLKECPKCGKPVRRLIGSGTAVLMKGGSSRGGKACSLESTGRTCCGRDRRCDKPPCGSNK